jgi:transposase InsO family protein
MKWIEAWPIATIKSEQAMEFFLDIIRRFGVPNSIITDNGTQFTGKEFLRFCDDYHIQVYWATVAHPRTNRQVERVNNMVLQRLKPRIFNRLKKFAGRWVAELPVVLWSLRTSPSRATSFTPFFMVYDSEVVLPTDLDYGVPRVRAHNEQGVEAFLEDAMDQLNEARNVTLLRSAKYQQTLQWYHGR